MHGRGVPHDYLKEIFCIGALGRNISHSSPWCIFRYVGLSSTWICPSSLVKLEAFVCCPQQKTNSKSLQVLFASWNGCHLIISNIQLPQSSQEGTCYEASGASRLKIFRPLGAWKGEQKVPKELPKPRFLQQNWGDSTCFVPNSIQKHLEM
jgi:hypothetical protein